MNRLVAIALLSAFSVFAQTNRGSISGTVTDQTGGVIAGASVTVTNLGTNEIRKVTTSDIGAFSVPNLEPVTYRLEAESKGFKKQVVQDIKVDTDELLPRHRLFALRSRWDAVTFQDVAHRLVADAVAQVDQGPHNAVIPPRTILTGHPHHEVFDLFLNARTANRLRRLGTIALSARECAMPSQDSVGLGNRRNLC